MVRKPPKLPNSKNVVNSIKQQFGRHSKGRAKTYNFPDLAFEKVQFECLHWRQARPGRITG